MCNFRVYGNGFFFFVEKHTSIKYQYSATSNSDHIVYHFNVKKRILNRCLNIYKTIQSSWLLAKKSIMESSGKRLTTLMITFVTSYGSERNILLRYASHTLLF